MSKQIPDTNEQRQQMRRQGLQQAEAAFDLYFEGSQDQPAVTFSQREDRVCALTRELAAWLLEQDLADDPAARPDEEHPPLCPKCGRPGQPRTRPDQPLPRRQLTSAAGEITLARQQWHCKTCRVSFFPSGPQAGTGHGGL